MMIQKLNFVYFQPHTSPVNCLTFDAFNSSKLISTSYDGTVRRFDLERQIFGLVYGTPENEDSYVGYHCQVGPSFATNSNQTFGRN